MVEIRSGTSAHVEMAAAFLLSNGLSSDALTGGDAQAGGALFTVACHGRYVVGLARGSQARAARGTGAEMPGRFHVNTVIVDPAFRGAGVGQGLVRRLLADARAGGFSTAQLWVHTNNAAALSLYGKFGFVPVGDGIDDERLGRIQQLAADLHPRVE